MYIDVSTFLVDFRQNLEDVTGDINTSTIIAYLRTALSRLAREKGMDELFLYQNTLELGRLKEDGSPAATWTINGIKEDDGERPLGQIMNIKSLLILKTADCKVRPVEPCYLPYKYFRKEHPFPEGECPGDPCFFTIYQFQGATKLIFDRPINKPYAIDMLYSAFHPRITSTKDVIRIPQDYEDLLIEYVKSLYYEGTSDFASSRAILEEQDYYISQIREKLHEQPDALGLRQIARSY